MTDLFDFINSCSEAPSWNFFHLIMLWIYQNNKELWNEYFGGESADNDKRW
jgi:hypothetical protein